MKKKHLRSISSIENWLSKHDLLTDEMKAALNAISKVIENAPENKNEEKGNDLPPPSEISNEPEALAIYSDGGCRGNPGPGSFAYLIQNHSGEILGEGVEFEAHTTNNRMELSGPIRGLSELKAILPSIGKDALLTKVKVITDSKYVVDGMKSWVQGWKSRGWKKADNKAPENLELWQELDELRNKFFQIDWIWVRGHGGHPQNEYCDKRANEAMDENIS